jgi:hypothetical protein
MLKDSQVGLPFYPGSREDRRNLSISLRTASLLWPLWRYTVYCILQQQMVDLFTMACLTLFKISISTDQSFSILH